MRIVFDSQIFRLQKFGGISRYYYELINNISRYEDVDIKIFSPLYVNYYIRNIKGVSLKGIPVGKIPKTGPVFDFVNFSLEKLFLKKDSSIDIFHQTYYSNWNNKPTNAKKVITVYDMISEKFHKDKNERALLWKKKSIQNADHIICISNNTKNDLIDILNISENKISVIYLSQSFDECHKIEQPSESLLPYILYVGERGGYKNFDLFISAYASSKILKNNFRIVCFGGGMFKREEIDFFRALGITPDTIFQTSGTDIELSNAYKSAYAFIYPSKYEGFGIPLLEAMNFRCPVLCSNTSSFPEVVSDAAITFEPGSIESIRYALERIAESNELRKKYIDLGLNRVKNFSWKKTGEQTLEVYRGLLSAG